MQDKSLAQYLKMKLELELESVPKLFCVLRYVLGRSVSHCPHLSLLELTCHKEIRYILSEVS